MAIWCELFFSLINFESVNIGMNNSKKTDGRDSNKQSSLPEAEDSYMKLLKKLQKTALELESEKAKHMKSTETSSRALSEAHSILGNMEKEKDERIRFFSLIAHDLRSPVGTIVSYMEVLTENFDELEPEEIKLYLINLKEIANNLACLTESLLTWTMHKLDKFLCEWSFFDLNNLIDKNLDLFSENLKQKKVTLINKMDDKIQAYADYDMVDAALRNIISNAIKYTERGGKIEINAKSLEKSIALSISDNGIGMDELRMNQLFNTSKATMLSHAGTQGERGTGMGLLLCKELVEKSGGTIRIESKVDQGTTVIIDLLKAPSNEHEKD